MINNFIFLIKSVFVIVSIRFLLDFDKVKLE